MTLEEYTARLAIINALIGNKSATRDNDTYSYSPQRNNSGINWYDTDDDYSYGRVRSNGNVDVYVPTFHSQDYLDI